VDTGDTILSKHVSDFKTIDSKDNQGHNIFGMTWQLKKELGLYCIQMIDTNYQSVPWKGVVLQQEINSYLNKHGSYKGIFSIPITNQLVDHDIIEIQ